MKQPNLRTAYVVGMHGLGDSIYQRVLIKALLKMVREVYLETPWPELYSDLTRVFPVKPNSPFRTQAKHERSFKDWRPPREECDWRIEIQYGPKNLDSGDSIIQGMEASGIPIRDDPLCLDLPARMAKPPIINTQGKPLALVRPVTVRSEWANVARNPRPEYIAEITEELRKTHFIVSLADLEEEAEWIVGDEPYADVRLHRGELKVPAMLELMRRADCVVSGVGWAVPAATALRVPAFIVLGGNGAHNAPNRVIDSRLPAPWIGFGVPDRFCMCRTKDHNSCDKKISDLMSQFNVWRKVVRC